MEILIRDTCTTCKGAKTIQHDMWKRLRSIAGNEHMDEEEIAKWFRDTYEEYYPPVEHGRCKECHGTGVSEQWVDALSLGIARPVDATFLGDVIKEMFKRPSGEEQPSKWEQRIDEMQKVQQQRKNQQ